MTNIRLELKILLEDTKYWIAYNTFSSEEIAIKFKQCQVFIHCFPNVNGRHFRMMADLIMESKFGNEIFSWHQSIMIKTNTQTSASNILIKSISTWVLNRKNHHQLHSKTRLKYLNYLSKLNDLSNGFVILP